MAATPQSQGRGSGWHWQVWLAGSPLTGLESISSARPWQGNKTLSSPPSPGLPGWASAAGTSLCRRNKGQEQQIQVLRRTKSSCWAQPPPVPLPPPQNHTDPSRAKPGAPGTGAQGGEKWQQGFQRGGGSEMLLSSQEESQRMQLQQEQSHGSAPCQGHAAPSSPSAGVAHAGTALAGSRACLHSPCWSSALSAFRLAVPADGDTAQPPHSPWGQPATRRAPHLQAAPHRQEKKPLLQGNWVLGRQNVAKPWRSFSEQQQLPRAEGGRLIRAPLQAAAHSSHCQQRCQDLGCATEVIVQIFRPWRAVPVPCHTELRQGWHSPRSHQPKVKIKFKVQPGLTLSNLPIPLSQAKRF